MDLFWIFKKEITDNSCGYFHWLFLPDSNKCFFICLATYIHPYLSLLFSHFVFLFSPSFFTLFATRHILLFTMFDLISLQPAYNITEIRKKHFIVHDERKSVTLIIIKTNALKIWYIQSMSFSSLLFTFLLTYYFVTKKYLNNIPYRNLSQNCKHSKIRKEHVLIFFNKFL